MINIRRRLQGRLGRIALATLIVGPSALIGSAGTASADSYVPIAGAGSTWSENAINQWISDVSQYGERVNYAGTGSSDGRSQFISGTVDFAASDIPFQTNPQDGSQPERPAGGSWAYMPVTAGGTVFMYNLHIGGQQVTNLRLSGQNITKIFTGQIKMWNDPALAADNPLLALPARTIVPVVRSDGSGSTAQLTTWMINQYPQIWNPYCQASGRAPACGLTSYYPTVPGMIAQSGDLGVAGYVSQSYADGAIGYVQYSYALNAHFPVATMLNSAGYYNEPSAGNVAVSLLNARVDTADVNDPARYLTEDLTQVYTDPDPRTYPLSAYSYLILPTTVKGQFTTAKGKTLAAFSYYAMCQGQQEASSLGYSPVPINLVQAAFGQIVKIPGAVVQNITIAGCNNPTFSSNGTNTLVTNTPFPSACAKQGATQCLTGTGGAANKPTAASRQTAAGAGPGGAAGGPGSGLGGGSATSAGLNPAAQVAASNCDPSVTTCADSAAGLGSSLASSPQTIAGRKGWTSTQSLMLLAALFTIGLVAAPGITSRFIRKRPR